MRFWVYLPVMGLPARLDVPDIYFLRPCRFGCAWNVLLFPCSSSSLPSPSIRALADHWVWDCRSHHPFLEMMTASYWHNHPLPFLPSFLSRHSLPKNPIFLHSFVRTRFGFSFGNKLNLKSYLSFLEPFPAAFHHNSLYTTKI